MTTDIALSGAAVPALPGDPDGELLDATAGWLRGFESVHTRNAYRRDLAGVNAKGEPAEMATPGWLPWCQQYALDPLTVRKRHVAAYARQLEADGHSPTTRARKLSAVSSWYDYLIEDEITERNPAKHTGRPSIDRDASPATGLSEDELNALLNEARADDPRSAALFSLLYFGAFRIGSVLGATVGDLGWDQGQRILKITQKGGHERKPVIEDAASDALDAYLGTRGGALDSEPLFITRTGTALTEPSAWRLLRRLARQAGIRSWAQLNPHSLRHSHITHARDEGVALDVIQETAGQKDPRTTLRYDRARMRRSNRSGTVLSDRRRRYEAGDQT